MRPAALEYLACPTCQQPLTLDPPVAPGADGHVMAGTLVCRGKACRYTIRDGVPVLLPGEVNPLSSETAGRFDQQWTHWRQLADYYEKQYLDWVAPITREDFAGKVVLEGGCGKGRHSHVVAGFGPRALVALDLGQSAWVAFANTRELPNVHVAVGDLHNPPVRPVIDLAFSVGVLHHLPDPALGFARLASRVRVGGRVVVWVYGQENNEWIIRFVDPVRKTVTAKLPPAALRALSMVPSAALWGAINYVYGGPLAGLADRLPYAEYFAGLRGFPLREIHNIVFDQLVTPVAYYLPKAEIERWFATGFSDVTIRWKGQYSWTGTGTVTGAPVVRAP